MINLETVKTLRALRLPGMARELESQLEDPQRYKDLSFEDRLALMVDAEGLSRRQNTITRRIREARLSESTASVESIEYHEDRELDKGLITKLATCSYIQENHHVILKGATGAGKSYIANALGVAACRKLYKVRYIRLPDLLNEFTVAKAMNTQSKVKTAYAKFDLLIIDEWLLRPLSEAESYDLLEIIEVCSKKGAIILCTQYDTDECTVSIVTGLKATTAPLLRRFWTGSSITSMRSMLRAVFPCERGTLLPDRRKVR